MNEMDDVSEWQGRSVSAVHSLFYFSLIPNDIRRCKICKKILDYNEAVIHHKNRSRKDNRRENLQLLCRPCHAKLHRIGRIKKNHRQVISQKKDLKEVYLNILENDKSILKR